MGGPPAMCTTSNQNPLARPRELPEVSSRHEKTPDSTLPGALICAYTSAALRARASSHRNWDSEGDWTGMKVASRNRRDAGELFA